MTTLRKDRISQAVPIYIQTVVPAIQRLNAHLQLPATRAFLAQEPSSSQRCKSDGSLMLYHKLMEGDDKNPSYD